MARTWIYPDLATLYANSGRLKTPTSKTVYRNMLRNLQGTYPKLTVERTTTTHLTDWCLSGNPSDSTIKARRSIVTAAFDYAAFRGIITSSPAGPLKYTAPSGAKPRRLHNWLTEQQIGQVLGSCDMSTFWGRRQRIILAVGFFMGLRVSSIANLRWDEFSSDLSRWEGVIKGNKRTRKGVPPQLREMLVEWRSEAPRDAVYVIPVAHRESFNSPAPAPKWDRKMSQERVRCIVREAGDRCGIKDMAPHDMRRSLAGVLQAKGVPVDKIRDVLDHSNIGTTDRYLNKNPNLKIEATEAIHFDF